MKSAYHLPIHPSPKTDDYTIEPLRLMNNELLPRDSYVNISDWFNVWPSMLRLYTDRGKPFVPFGK